MQHQRFQRFDFLCQRNFLFFLSLPGCQAGKFGKDCASDCGHCFQGEPCDVVTGICPHNCSVGYIGLYCTQGMYQTFRFRTKTYVRIQQPSPCSPMFAQNFRRLCIYKSFCLFHVRGNLLCELYNRTLGRLY